MPLSIPRLTELFIFAIPSLQSYKVHLHGHLIIPCVLNVPGKEWDDEFR